MRDLFGNFDVIIPLNVATILFGYTKEGSNSKINIIILVAKRYIWSNKFNGTPLSINAFRNIFKKKLNEIKDMFEYGNEQEKFDGWQPIYDVI